MSTKKDAQIAMTLALEQVVPLCCDYADNPRSDHPWMNFYVVASYLDIDINSWVIQKLEERGEPLTECTCSSPYCKQS